MIRIPITHKAIEALRHTLAQDEIDKFQREFAITMSHEIRTPLSIIVAAAETLLTVEVSAAKREELLKTISEAAHRLEYVPQLLENGNLAAERRKAHHSN